MDLGMDMSVAMNMELTLKKTLRDTDSEMAKDSPHSVSKGEN